MGKVVILGAGGMGCAMAAPAVAMGHRVALVGTPLDQEVVRTLAGGHVHPRLGLALPAGVTAHPAEAFAQALGHNTDLLILGVSSTGVPWAIDRLVATVRRPLPVLILTKGVAAREGRIEVMPHLVAGAYQERTGRPLSVMAAGGPCIAAELAAGRHTSVVLAGDDRAEVERTVALLSAPFYHARPSSDVLGVELCAAFKNLFAIGVGWAAGHFERERTPPLNGAQMHNPTASLFAQAVRELELLVVALGGSRESVHGLPGLGDLYVTAQAGRNARMGRLLGLGLTYAAAKSGHMADDTVEGADLAFAVGPTLETMWRDGRLPAEEMPLARAVVRAVCQDEPMWAAWERFHR